MATRTEDQTTSTGSAFGGIVRRFSHHMLEEAPNDQLSVALANQEARDEEEEERQRRLDSQWKSLFIPGAAQQFETEEEARLDSTSQELAKAWEKFQQYLPKEHRLTYKDKPPNFEDVAKAVANANAVWKEKQQTKSGRAKSLFTNLCEKMNDYKQVMAPIPSQDKYLSLLTGSFSVVVTATINHKKIAEGVSNCLESLGDNIGYWKRQLMMHNDNNFMKRYVVQLYILVFQLLVDIMHWFSSTPKRFIGSFDEQGFEKLVKNKKDKMQALAQKLENEAKLATEIKIKNTQDDVKALLARSEQPNTEDLVARFLDEIDKRLSQHEQRVGKSIQRTLRDEAKALAWELQNRGLQARPSWKSIKDEETTRQDVSVGSHTITKEELQTWATSLHKYRQTEALARLASRSREMDVNIEVLRRVKLLLSNSSTSQSLWICGPSQVSTPSRMTLIASNLRSAAEKAEIPLLTYFCQRDDVLKNSSQQDAKGVTRFVYSLISQMVDLPSEDIFQTEIEFSSSRFTSLDGGADSLLAATFLLKDLLTLRPPVLFCFFDGLQLLQRGLPKLEAETLKEIVQMLRRPPYHTTNDGVVETVYTTDGFFDILGVLRGQERLNMSDFDSEDRIGKGIDAIEFVNRIKSWEYGILECQWTNSLFA